MRKTEKEDEKKRLEAKRLKEVADHEERRAGANFFSLFFYVCVCICISMYIRIYIHMYDTYIHAHFSIHICTHTYTHTHTHSGEAARRTAGGKGAFSRAKMWQVQPGVLKRQEPRRAVRSQR